MTWAGLVTPGSPFVEGFGTADQGYHCGNPDGVN